MNTPILIMLAHGEGLILPALLVIFGLVVVVYPTALWVLLKRNAPERSRPRIACAVVLVVLCAGGALATLRDFTWPPDWGDYVGFLIWLFPFCCGALALLGARRTNHA